MENNEIRLTETERNMLPFSIEQTADLVKMLPRFSTNLEGMSKAQLGYLYDGLSKAMKLVIEAQLNIK